MRFAVLRTRLVIFPEHGITLAFSSVGYFPSLEEDEVGTRINWSSRLFATVVLVLLTGTWIAAQQMSMEEGKRRVKLKSQPVYPELARKMNIAGKVRIEVVIAPDGRVKSTRAVGGHPLLIQPCLDSVKDWRFEPGPEETTQMIEFNFKD